MKMNKANLDIDWVIKKYMPFFENYGMDEKNIREHYKTWASSRPALIKDYVWYIFNKLLLETAKQSKNELELYEHQINIKREMLYFRRKVEKKKANEILQNILELEIKRNVLRIGLPFNVIIVSGHCCEYCDSLNDCTFSSDDVFKNKYLGSNSCTNEEGCNCTYAYEVIR